MDDLFADANKQLEFAPSKRSSLQSKLDRQEIETPPGNSMDALFEQRSSGPDQRPFSSYARSYGQSNAYGQSYGQSTPFNQPKTLPAIMSMLSSVLGSSADGIQAPVTQRVDITQYPNKQN
jgi:hypothetical protein